MAPDGNPPVPVIEFKKADMESWFVDGFKAAIGRADPPKSYVFVLGEAGSREKAVAVADDEREARCSPGNGTHALHAP